MRHAPRVLLAAGLGFAVSFLVACGGGSNLLSGDQSSTLNGRLDEVSAAVDGGQCGGATRATASFSNYVSNLPSKVSPTLRANLLQGVSTVNDLAQRDCQTAAQSTSSSTTTSSTTTSPTTTTPSSTASTTTVSTTTPSTTSTTPATSSTTPSTTSTTQTTGGAGIGGTSTTGGGGNGTGGGAPGQQ
jgi:cobalamin biosynthesis Mg chelatase CobN